METRYGVYGDLIIIYPTPKSIYLRGTIGHRRVHAVRLAHGIAGRYGPWQFCGDGVENLFEKHKSCVRYPQPQVLYVYCGLNSLKGGSYVGLQRGVLW